MREWSHYPRTEYSFLVQWEGVNVLITAKRAVKNIAYKKCQITDIHL